MGLNAKEPYLYMN